MHSDGGSLTLILRGSASETFAFDAVDTYAVEIGEFANCLRAGTRPLHTEKEGIDVLCLILAAYEGRVRGPSRRSLRWAITRAELVEA
jgi:predicted dehydrogenase